MIFNPIVGKVSIVRGSDPLEDPILKDIEPLFQYNKEEVHSLIKISPSKAQIERLNKKKRRNRSVLLLKSKLCRLTIIQEGKKMKINLLKLNQKKNRFPNNLRNFQSTNRT